MAAQEKRASSGRGTSTARRREPMRSSGSWGLGLFVYLLLFDSPLLSQDQPKTQPPTAPIVAAKVGSTTISLRDVAYEVRRAISGQTLPDPIRVHLQAQALQQLVDRRIVLDYLDREGQAAGNQEVEQAMLRLTGQLTRQKKTLAQHLQQLDIDESTLRSQFAWQISWRKYLERYFTDENLQKFFDKNRRDFDGTQLQVAHILFKLDAERSPASRQSAVEQARKVRQEIIDGKLKFAEAAAKYSAAPTAKQGGDIGVISRRDPMPEAFSRVAFSLDKGAVSEPSVTDFGIHLITVLEVMPGQKTWKDVRPELEPALAQYLFEWLAGRERAAAQVEFTGKAPYFDPKTGEVVGGSK